MHRISLVRLPLSTLLRRAVLASSLALPGCILTIDDDFDTGNDELGDTGTTTEDESGTTTTTSTTTDDETTSTETTGDGDTTETGTTTDGETETTDGTTETGDGDGDCAPMAAMNGPEECFNPRGWFWNGEACEQIICTCDGADCNALFPDEMACTAVYGQCQPLPGECDPQQADGIGMCELFLGWKWDGIDCVPLSGCNCEGPDCANLYAEPDLCKDAHAGCGFGGECEPDDALPVGDCDLFLGVVWTGDNCLGISGCECVGADCDNLPLDEMTCWDEHGLCELGDPCLPDDAIGDGLCDAFFGYAWNGSECVGQSGCDCIGLDCEFLPFEQGVCEAEHAGCGGEEPPCPGIQDANGVGLCQLFLGWKWNGMTCEGVSGCSCEGPDCDFLYPELDICELESAGCL